MLRGSTRRLVGAYFSSFGGTSAETCERGSSSAPTSTSGTGTYETIASAPVTLGNRHQPSSSNKSFQIVGAADGNKKTLLDRWEEERTFDTGCVCPDNIALGDDGYDSVEVTSLDITNVNVTARNLYPTPPVYQQPSPSAKTAAGQEGTAGTVEAVPTPSGCCWPYLPAGWSLTPCGTKATKKYEFGDFTRMYQWLGRATLLAHRLETYPEIDWFYQAIEITLPITPESECIALYMNDQEILHTMRKNTTTGAGKEEVEWNTELTDSLNSDMENNFCWLMTPNKEATNEFIEATYLQWGHRADYLVHRRSREKKEFRQNLTFDQVMLESQQRKRRLERREAREQKENAMKEKVNSPEYRQRVLAKMGPVGAMKKRNQEGDNGFTSQSMQGPSFFGVGAERPQLGMREDADGSSFISDVLPREVREEMDKEHDGMEDSRMGRTGTFNTYRRGLH